VVDTAGNALPNIQVVVTDSTNVVRARVRSPEGPRPLLQKLPAGAYVFVARQLGRQPGAIIVRLRGGDTVSARIVLGAAMSLDAVQIQVARNKRSPLVDEHELGRHYIYNETILQSLRKWERIKFRYVLDSSINMCPPARSVYVNGVRWPADTTIPMFDALGTIYTSDVTSVAYYDCYDKGVPEPIRNSWVIVLKPGVEFPASFKKSGAPQREPTHDDDKKKTSQ